MYYICVVRHKSLYTRIIYMYYIRVVRHKSVFHVCQTTENNRDTRKGEIRPRLLCGKILSVFMTQYNCDELFSLLICACNVFFTDTCTYCFLYWYVYVLFSLLIRACIIFFTDTCMYSVCALTVFMTIYRPLCCAITICGIKSLNCNILLNLIK